MTSVLFMTNHTLRTSVSKFIQLVSNKQVFFLTLFQKLILLNVILFLALFCSVPFLQPFACHCPVVRCLPVTLLLFMSHGKSNDVKLPVFSRPFLDSNFRLREFHIYF